MSSFLTPGVYTEEVPVLPPSVAGVSTAVPAFIGFTEKAIKEGKSISNIAVRISTFLEFKEMYGGAQQTTFDVVVENDQLQSVKTTPPKSILYYALDLYFKNGGGDCYIVSVGSFESINSNFKKKAFETGISILSKEDEPTLIMLTDATALSATDYYSVCQAALSQCAELKDRFCIFDTKQGDEEATEFRDKIGANNLKYGAAYTPFLQTSLNYIYNDTDVTVTSSIVTDDGTEDPSSVQEEPFTLDSKKDTALYSKIKSELAKETIVLPPSAAVAGIYATTDRERGVWKSPANVSVNSVIGPVVKISSADQERLNVDATAGKSVNAIRSFVGKGTMVWGARTLAGNDNEWRYVSVRRLFNMIEESTKKASHFAVFESNDATTWLKVKAMIESFLYGIWQQGGLVGSTEEQAYFVNVGLGKTMTQQDILEGRMVVEIGIAAARPAEFIILKFSHKLQEV